MSRVQVRAHTRKAPKRASRQGKNGKPASKPAGKPRKAVSSRKASGGKAAQQGRLL